MNALFIDSVQKKISKIELGKNYREIVEKIGNNCDIFCCPIRFRNGDTLFADDESLLRKDDIRGGFILKNAPNTPIVGNAIILGSDIQGNSVDVLSKENDLEIIWMSESQSKEYADYVSENFPIFISIK